MIKEIKKELSKFLKALKFESTELQPDQVKISDRTVGAKVELIDAEGNLTPIPDGEYKVDEFEFTVKDGVISEIKDEAKPTDEKQDEDFEDVKALQIGDEVTINPDAKEFMSWYEGVSFVVNSIDGYGDGMVGLTNSKGYFVTCTKAESLTKTGNKVDIPKDEQFADESAAVDALKKETESLKEEIAQIKELIANLAGKSEMEQFKSEITNLNKTLEAVAKTPAEFSKTTNNPINKEKQNNTASILATIMKKK